MLYYVATILVVAVIIFEILVRHGRMGKLLNRFPGPNIFPILGNLLFFHFRSHDIFNTMRYLAREYYPTVRIWFCTSGMIGISHPDDLEILLSSQKAIDKGYVYNYIEPWLKTGLLTSTGEKWRQRRKILTPAFHFQILKKYMDITSEQGEKLIEGVRQQGKETVQSLLPLCSMFTLNIICESAMGVALDKMDEKSVEKYTSAIHDIGDVVVQRSIKPYILDWMMGSLIQIGRRQNQALKVLHNFTHNVVKERREYHRLTDNKYLQEVDNDTDESADKIATGGKKRLAMLDLLLLAEQKGSIDNAGIMEEIDTFSFEGHDTTGMALIFILMLLAENEESQEKAREEIREQLDGNKGKIDTLVLQKLNYVERCIKESLRLYPSVPNIIRHLNEDLQLKNSILPAGTDIFCFIIDTHRDPKFWPEPEKFDPDRFLPERSVGRHPFAYLPFSAGPRNCIGQKFAMMELKSLVARILYNFHLEPITRTTEVKFVADLVLRPSHPVKIKFVRIDKD